MGQRRMFSNRIANSARFLQMPAETQLLYFHMILRADDDGVVEAYPLERLLNVAPDNLKVLIGKGFVKKLNDDQVVVILDWLEHNTIRADRKVDSIYKDLLKQKLPEITLIEPKPRSDVDDNSRRIIGGPSTDGISKVKLSKDKIIREELPAQINPFRNKYAPSMLKDFELYWDEGNAKGINRWKTEKTWDIQKRLERWQRTQEKWDHEKSARHQVKSTNEMPVYNNTK